MSVPFIQEKFIDYNSNNGILYLVAITVCGKSENEQSLFVESVCNQPKIQSIFLYKIRNKYEQQGKNT